MQTSVGRAQLSSWSHPGLPLPFALAYPLLYLALDWVSFIHPMTGLHITPWNPQSALAVALMTWRRGAWWLVWLSAACSEAVVRSIPGSWMLGALAAGALTAGYAATAAALVRWLGPRPRLATRREFAIFVAVVSLGALAAAVLHVAVLSPFGIPQPDRALVAVYRGWVGDAVGLLVTLPLFLMLASRERRASAAATLRSAEWWLVALIAGAATLVIFTRPTGDEFKYFYLLFLPVAWAAARFGMAGAVCAAALVQVLVIGAVQSATYRPLTVFELQLLMAALAATGLLLGTTVDEREEADRNLRASLRLAAAGDMAAALAHELNQPLSAMSTYARASQLLATRLGEHNQELALPLIDATDKLSREASRAAEVVKRLRNFFRDRTTELQLTAASTLLDGVMRTQTARAEAVRVRLEWRCANGLPTVWLDPVQIAVVLRNLVTNALDAAAARGDTGDAFVRVEVTLEGHEVVFAVLDSGPGLLPEQIPGAFESRQSTKAGGMGVGLGISRSIVEAHGGRMWAEPGPGGRFYFSLPISSPSSNE